MAEHCVIVIAFDQYRVQSADDFSKPAEDMPQVGEQTESLPGLDIFDDEAYAVDSIVRSSQGLDSQRTNLKMLAGYEIVRTSNATRGLLRTNSVPSSKIRVDRQAVFSVKHADTANVIEVFV